MAIQNCAQVTREFALCDLVGKPTSSNFDYASLLTQANHLGNVAYRVGKKLEWDPVNLKATSCPEADRYIRKEYRSGWTL